MWYTHIFVVHKHKTGTNTHAARSERISFVSLLPIQSVCMFQVEAAFVFSWIYYSTILYYIYVLIVRYKHTHTNADTRISTHIFICTLQYNVYVYKSYIIKYNTNISHRKTSYHRSTYRAQVLKNPTIQYSHSMLGVENVRTNICVISLSIYLSIYSICMSIGTEWLINFFIFSFFLVFVLTSTIREKKNCTNI